jgi:predicted nuclease of predicted toxin-antitoxin system
MRLLVDAQLPRRLALWLQAAGHDALHTLDLPRGNATTDAELIAFARAENRVVVSKDDDFVQSYWLTNEPRLLLIATGNIHNLDLEKLIQANLSGIEAAFKNAEFVELTRVALVIHS